jgi:hypothetical protein
MLTGVTLKHCAPGGPLNLNQGRWVALISIKPTQQREMGSRSDKASGINNQAAGKIKAPGHIGCGQTLAHGIPNTQIR